ncbi:MAG: hypothetical protein LBK04_02260 [Clostridiales Family XIII bacterium]|nr:hypothetical protein [Clostridiales Family XIII bacterium]
MPPVEGIFCDGKIFDAYAFAANLTKKAKKRIILLDNYVDETVLLLLSKRKAKVSAEAHEIDTHGSDLWSFKTEKCRAEQIT